jgi:peptidoglycan/LPS O-acetylase OafA/YrhL
MHSVPTDFAHASPHGSAIDIRPVANRNRGATHAGPADGVTPDRVTADVAKATTRSPAARTRVAVLDGLRLMAALMVVSYHYIARGDAWTAASPHGFPHLIYVASRFGFFGVELFFLISGFVICMSGMGRSLGQFFVARVVRLYPAYWFAVLATAVVVTLWPTINQPLAHTDVVTNLTMLQIPLHTPNVDGVYWTLWVELRFYLLFALVVFFGVTYRRVVAFCALWTVASVATMAVGGPLLDDGRSSTFLQLAIVPQYSPYFIAGMAFFLMHRFRPDPLLWGIVGIQLMLAIHHLRVDPMIMHKFTGTAGSVEPIVIVFFFAIMALVALHKLTVGWRWLTVAGTLTYPLYLLHQHIGWILIDKLQHEVPAPIVVVAVVALMLIAAWLVHRFIEKPVAARMRCLLVPAIERLRPPRAATAGLPVASAPRSRQPATSTPGAAAESVGRSAAIGRASRLDT